MSRFVKVAIVGLVAVGQVSQLAMAQQLYAQWTGGREPIQMIGGGAGYNCEYSYGGQRFWRAFRDGCPPSVPI